MSFKSETLNRDERRAWLNEELAERNRQRKRQSEQQGAASELEKHEFWAPFAHRATTTNELNIAWKQACGFFTWQRVLLLQNLLALRITGHDLHDIPEALASTLPLIETLSFIDDKLESLPESIGTLQNLTSLDLTKNRFQQLPVTFTNLTKLRILNLSSNILEELPEQFGKLGKLEKVWLERNKLTTLPESIGMCQSLMYANLSNNKLVKLPESIGGLVSLETLSLNMNKLIELPDTIVSLPKLRTFNASRNQFTRLPRHIGDMQALRQLRLDWNYIQELPSSFRALTKLQVLCMEQNPMRIPTSDVIARGVLETLRFMHKAFEELQRSSRRETAEALQDVLAFAASLILMNTSIKRQLASNDDLHIIMSYFEPECDHLAPTPSKELRVYGVVWERFYSDLLPAIERQQALTQTISQQYPQNKAKVDQKPFSHRFSAEEIEDALINYNDAFSTVSMTGDASSGVLVEFRRCACLNSVTSNEKGQSFQKVCLPRENPFNCQRLGRLIRAQMLTMEQAQDQLASSYFRRKVDRLVQKTRCRTIDYVNSAAGMAQFEKSARFLAHEMVSRRHRLRQLLKTFEKAQQHLCSRRNKLCRQIENLKRAKETQVQALRDKWARTENAQKKLQYELENAIAKDKDGAVVAVKSKKIKKLNEKLDVLRIELEGTGTGDEKMNKIELAIASLDMEEQKLVKVTEKSWALEMEIDLENEEREKEFDVVDAEEDDEEDEDGEEEDEESEDEEEDSNLDVEGNTDEASCSESEEKVKAEGFTSSSSKPFFNINMPKEMVVDYRKTAILAVDKELERLANDENQKKGNKSKTEIITKRPQFTIPHIVSEEKLLELFRTQLRDSYVEMQCAKVSTQVTKEFLQMRAVLQRWRGLNALAVFEAWHQVAHLNRLNAKAFKSSSEQIKILDKQNQELEEEFARMDARLWVQRSDAYTDAIYYENEQTGETSYTPPQYWTEEQQKHVKFDDIPRIKLPLIR